jgi:hypothetical protein
MKKYLYLALALSAFALLAPGLQAQTFGPNGTTTLSVTVAAESAIEITSATTTFAAGASAFTSYTGTTTFSYKERTGKAAGSGTITVEVTTDFGAGGPSVGSPLAGDQVTYTCSTSGSGTACSGSVNASTTAATNVLTFGANAHSAKAGDSGSVVWTIPDDPAYQQGAYTATATFTISAT